MNSVFTHEAVDHGLDMAIVNYTKIFTLYRIPQEEVDLARKLIFPDESGGDPAAAKKHEGAVEYFSGQRKGWSRIQDVTRLEPCLQSQKVAARRSDCVS
jgi:cobalamin-dependent methionine synthase I